MIRQSCQEIRHQAVQHVDWEAVEVVISLLLGHSCWTSRHHQWMRSAALEAVLHDVEYLYQKICLRQTRLTAFDFWHSVVSTFPADASAVVAHTSRGHEVAGNADVAVGIAVGVAAHRAIVAVAVAGGVVVFVAAVEAAAFGIDTAAVAVV